MVAKTPKGIEFQRSNGLDFGIWLAIEEVFHTYGVRVDVDRRHIDKFGAHFNAGITEVEINSLNKNETYQTSNTINSLISSNAADTTEVLVEGMSLDVSSGVFSEVSQTIELTGQTPAPLVTPLARCNRMINTNGTPLAGDIYVYTGGPVTAGVPDSLPTVHKDRKSTRLNSSHRCISYAVFCLKKKKKTKTK